MIRGTADRIEVERTADGTAVRDGRSRDRRDGTFAGRAADDGAGASAEGAEFRADAHVGVGIPSPVATEAGEALDRSVPAISAKAVADRRRDAHGSRKAVPVNADVGAGALVAADMVERGDAGAKSRSGAAATRTHATAAKPIHAAADERAGVGTADRAARVRKEVRSNAARAASNRREGSSNLDDACLRTMAKTALTTMGWKPAVARAAVAAAIDAHGDEMTLEQLVRESLRRCRSTKA